MTTTPVKTLPRRVRHLHRRGGAAGAPTTLYADELFINEGDANGVVVYAGIDDDGFGNSKSQVPIGGPGAFSPLKVVQDGTGAATQNLRDKPMRQVDTADFCLFDGTVETTRLQQALGAPLGTKMQTIMHGAAAVKTGSVTVPVDTIFRGTGHGHARQPGESLYAPFSQIRLTSGSTLALSTGAKLEDLYIVADGLNDATDEPSIVAQRAAMASATTLAVGQVQAFSQDITIRDCFIIGFNKAISFNQGGRVIIDRLRADCTNGIEVLAGLDNNIISNCHIYPFMYAAFETNAGSTGIHPGGTGYRIGNGSIPPAAGGYDDGSILINNFCYGFDVGYRLTSAIGLRMDWNYSDSGTFYGSYGVIIEGVSYENTIANHSETNYNTGLWVNCDLTLAGAAPSRYSARIMTCDFNGIQYGIRCTKGNLFGRAVKCGGGTASFLVEATFGFFDVEFEWLEGTQGIVIDIGWTGRGRIVLPQHGGWTNVVAIRQADGVTISTAGLQAMIDSGQLTIEAAGVIHGASQPNVDTANRRFVGSGIGAEFFDTVAPANNGFWTLKPGTVSINGSTYGTLSINGYSDDLSTGAQYLTLIRSGTAFLTYQTGQLPVAASDSAAASLNVPVGGYYKTSAGAVMQRTT